MNFKILRLGWGALLVIAFFLSPAFAGHQTEGPAPASPTLKEQKKKEGYIVNLKDLINKSKEKIGKVDEKIKEQQRRQRNLEREEKARQYYEKAMQLYEEGKYDKARELWDKAIKITEHPEMKDYIRESAHRSKKQEDALRKEEELRLQRLEVERGYSAKEVEDKYQEGVSLFKQNKFLASQNSFEEVEDMFPDHKATRSYLMIIDQNIREEQQRLIDEKLREEAIAQREAKDEWKKELEQKEKERQEQLKAQAEKLYQEAVRLYKARNFEEAKKKFKEIEWIMPNYKLAVYYLARIEKGLVDQNIAEEKEIAQEQAAAEEKEIMARPTAEDKEKLKKKEEQLVVDRMKEEADFVYHIAVSLYEEKLYKEANERFQEAQTLYPHYKAADKYLSRIKHELQRQSREEQKKQQAHAQRMEQQQLASLQAQDAERLKKEQKKKEKQKQDIESLYQEGFSSFNAKDYPQAQDQFAQVLEQDPNHRPAHKYLKKVEKILSEEQKEKEIQEAKRSPKIETPEQAVTDIVVKQAIEERQKQLMQEADVKYKEALSLLKDRNYVVAKRKLIQVEAIYPGYKETENYLSRIDEDIQKNSIQKGRPQKRGLKESTTPGRSEIVNVPSAAERPKAKAKFVPPSPALGTANPILGKETQKQEELKHLYAQAVNLYKTKQYLSAQEVFEAIEHQSPRYQSTRSYLEKIGRKLEEKENRERQAIEHAARTQAAESQELAVPSSVGILPASQPAEEKGREAKLKKEARDRAVLLKAESEKLRKIERERQKEIERKLREEELARKKEEKLRLDQERIIAKELAGGYRKERLSREQAEKEAQQLAAKKQKELEQTIRQKQIDSQSAQEQQRKQAKQIELAKQQVTEKEEEHKSKIVQQQEIKRLKKEIAQLYREAIAFYQKENMHQANERFNEVDMLLSSGQLPNDYLAEWRERLNKDKEKIGRHLKTKKEKEEIAERKQKEKWDKEKAALEQRKKDQEFTKMKGEVNRTYEEALSLYRQNKIEESKEQFKRFEDMLAQNNFPDSYRREMRERLNRDQEKMKQKIKEDSANAAKAALREAPGKGMPSLGKKQTEEIQALEKKIRIEQEKLNKEKQRFDVTLNAEEQKTKEQKETAQPERAQGIVISPKQPAKKNLNKEDANRLDKNKSEEVAKIVRERQKELSRQRERIRKEFQEKIERLYRAAVELHRSGAHDQARRIFKEIQTMSPGYKKTEKYLAKIDSAPAGSAQGKGQKSSSLQAVVAEHPHEQTTNGPSRSKVISQNLDLIEHKP
jgi:outer membrane protein assembly factor BamD (BamD/ComL family)